ncbi:uncharacterized protein PRCAT00001770001 [Priceomyces carsonii]|uniref:uncharacterized protein n=1 Tax=Priceomyces carsonii TaxID=28549 RepID=UPI002ED9E6D9|nr:unnamed protein product [Priceomyces carsonii]
MIVRSFILLLIHLVVVLAVPFKSTGRNDPRKQFISSNLPGLYENIPKNEIPLMFSGQLKLYEENNTHLYYWKYSDQNKLPENKKRSIFWLNGGPGCSSMDGALMEAGPFRINDELKVTYNNGSWHKLADMIFVDQPAGTGFSFSDEYSKTLDESTAVFMKFLEKYFEVFPEELDNEVYIAGESYAGQYIPYIAERVLKRNKELKKNEKIYNLKGLLIGNGWISPVDQGLSYLPFSYQAGLIREDNSRWGELLRKQERCQKLRDKIDGAQDLNTALKYEDQENVCENILTTILEATSEDNQCINMYDYTLRDSYPSCGMNWPPDLKNVNPFLRDDKVMEDLNIAHKAKWMECSGKVSRNLDSNPVPSIYLLPKILSEIPIVLFNGNRDIICNYLGTENLIKRLEWNGKVGFSEDTEAMNWIYDNKTAGYIKSERNLTFINVFDSSHMVPFDKPDVSRSLIDIITGNFDIESRNEGKSSLITYKIGLRHMMKSEGQGGEPLPVQSTPAISSSADLPSSETDDLDKAGNNSENGREQNSSKITRLIQLLVLLVLVWGVYVLYSSYKSRPSSIIKSGPSSGKKKNVQWADQLRQFQEDDIGNQPPKQGFFMKTFSKLRGADPNGVYSPASNKYEDIELGEHVNQNNAHNDDDFIIESEDETELPIQDYSEEENQSQLDHDSSSFQLKDFESKEATGSR